MSIIQGNSKTSAAAAYEISQSVRFNDNDSAHLSRTPSSSGSATDWTLSTWVKLGNLGTDRVILSAGTGGNHDWIQFQSNDTLRIVRSGSSILVSNQVFRDPSGWGNLVVESDIDNATASEKLKVYWNGSEITSWSTDTRSSYSSWVYFNQNVIHNIGRRSGSNDRYFDGYMAEINFIDGTALGPTNFGETNADTGQWVPIEYTGSYGTNGYYLKGQDSSALGDDSSGNNNDWTSSGLTAADQMLDTPTDNYGVMNPLDNGRPSNVTLSDGNLTAAFSGAGYEGGIRSSIFFDSEDSDGWYAECTLDSLAFASIFRAGVANASLDLSSTDAQSNANGWAYSDQGAKLNNSYTTGYGSSVTVGDVVGIAVRNGKIYFAVNNTWQGSADPVTESNPAFSNLLGDVAFCQSTNTGGSYAHTATWNFGQTGFTYTPPTGYKSLRVQDLPDPTIADPSAYFQTTLYTGTGSSLEVNQIGNSTFQPDFVWIKQRTKVDNHVLTDAVRGTPLVVNTNRNVAELPGTGGIESLDADGFTLGTWNNVNQSTITAVAWQWKANGSGSSNTDGSITSTVSANTTSGFSICKFNPGGNVNITFGHGLGVAPRLVIVKNLDSATNWQVLHLDQGVGNKLFLNSNAAPTSDVNMWQNTAPTSTVVSVGTAQTTAEDHIAYCFAEVEGFSKIDMYTGNGSTNGAFVYTGFKPSFVLWKQFTNLGTNNFIIRDSAREPFNVVDTVLFPNTTAGDTTDLNGYGADLLSNGFKLRGNDGAVNKAASDYLYLAFAESPFKTATAR